MDGNSNIDATALIQKWFIGRCNGDWEHSWGVKIETLDNPGWIIKIDLKDTHKAYEHFDQVKIHRSENDWVICKIENTQCVGKCGPLNLDETI
jgi:Immunity protein 53